MEKLVTGLLLVNVIVILIWLSFLIMKSKQYKHDERGQAILAKATIPLVVVIILFYIGITFYTQVGHPGGSVTNNLILFASALTITTGLVHIISIKYYEYKF